MRKKMLDILHRPKDDKREKRTNDSERDATCSKEKTKNSDKPDGGGRRNPADLFVLLDNHARADEADPGQNAEREPHHVELHERGRRFAGHVDE